MGRFDAIADLPLYIDHTALTLNVRETIAFERKTTTVTLGGEGQTGRGEDVTYDAAEHEDMSVADFPSLTGRYTLRSFSARLDDMDLFPTGPPERPVFRNYRRWGFESAALDLALRQADTNIGAVLDTEFAPVRFVVSPRLGDPPTTERLEALRDLHTNLEFKLDADATWTDELVDAIVAFGGTPIVDLKGQYPDTQVNRTPDTERYRLVIERFPDAILEDPGLTAATRSLLEPVAKRVSWDAPIHSIDDVETRPWAPVWLNCKPSRFGTLESLCAFLDYCEHEGIALYGGGQFELDVGRGQIQLLASLAYPDGPNDVAPAGYNDPDLDPSLPDSPLSPPESPIGFRWS